GGVGECPARPRYVARRHSGAARRTRTGPLLDCRSRQPGGGATANHIRVERLAESDGVVDSICVRHSVRAASRSFPGVVSTCEARGASARRRRAPSVRRRDQQSGTSGLRVAGNEGRPLPRIRRHVRGRGQDGRERRDGMKGVARMAVPVVLLVGGAISVRSQTVVRTGDIAVRGLKAGDFPRITKLADNVYGYEQLDPTKRGVTVNNLI